MVLFAGERDSPSFKSHCNISQLISSLKYLHAHKVIHRDLKKLGNLFLNDNMEIKVGDFGLPLNQNLKEIGSALNVEHPIISRQKFWMANKDIHLRQMWSLGVILYTLLIGKPPFETSDVKQTYKRIKSNYYTFPDTTIISEQPRI